MGQVARTKFWSLRLDSPVKMGGSHDWTWSPGLVVGTSHRDYSPRVCRPYNPDIGKEPQQSTRRRSEREHNPPKTDFPNGAPWFRI